MRGVCAIMLLGRYDEHISTAASQTGRAARSWLSLVRSPMNRRAKVATAVAALIALVLVLLLVAPLLLGREDAIPVIGDGPLDIQLRLESIRRLADDVLISAEATTP